MADLIDKAPAETPAAPSDGVQPAAAPPADAPPPSDGQAPPEKRPPVDLDARLEEVLAESRRVSDLDKQAAARLKKAEELEAKWGTKGLIDEHLKKGDRKAAVKALLDGKLDEELLFDLASELAAATSPGAETAQPKTPSLEEQVAAIMAAREKEAADKKAAEDKVKAEADQKAAQQQLDTSLTGAAKYLKENYDKFPFLKAWGCPPERYTELLLQHAEKTGQLPEPQVLLQAMEDEHLAKWKKSPHAPAEAPAVEDLDAHVARAYERHKPPPGAEQTPARPKTALEMAREELQAYDREQAERIRYSQGR
jgi:hypothetical protein